MTVKLCTPRSCFLTAGMFLALFGSCDLKGPAGPAGPILTGTLSGFVLLVNANGDQPANRDSVQVSLDVSSLSALTDSAGRWSIPNLQAGIYTVSYSKTGYGLSKSTQVQFTGGGERTLGYVSLCQAPSFSIDSIAPRMPRNGDSNSVYLRVKASDIALNGQYKTILFFSADSTVSWMPDNYLSVSAENLFFKNGIDSTNVRLAPVFFATAGFQSGDTLYGVAYAANAGSNNSGYTDLNTDRFVYTNIDTAAKSNVLQIVVP